MFIKFLFEKRYNENRTMKLNPLLKSLKRSLDDLKNKT